MILLWFIITENFNNKMAVDFKCANVGQGSSRNIFFNDNYVFLKEMYCPFTKWTTRTDTNSF